MGMSFSQSYYHRSLGISEKSFIGSSKGDAMGGTSLMSDGTAFWAISNPAALTELKSNSVVISGQMNRYKENRSFPVHDFFGDYLVDASYVFNSINYYDYAIAGAYKFGISTIGFGISPFHTFDYNYTEEVHRAGDSNIDGLYRDPLAGYHIEEYDGTIIRNSLSLGIKLYEYISIGFGFHLLNDFDFGDRRAVIVLDPENTENLSESETDDVTTIIPLTGSKYYSVGLLIKNSESSKFSFNYNSELNFSIDDSINYTISDGETTSSTNISSNGISEYIIPESIKFGFCYTPKQEYPAELVFEYEWNFYSKLDSLWSISTELFDEEIYRFGLEHIAGENIPVRVGMIYRKSPLMRELTESIFTAGLGKSFGNFVLDISGRYSKMSYGFEDQFIPSGDISNPTGMETINETKIGISCTIQYLFD